MAEKLLKHFTPLNKLPRSPLNHFTPLGGPTLKSFYPLKQITPSLLHHFTLTPPPPRQPNSYLILGALDKLPPHSYTILPPLAAQLLNHFTPLNKLPRSPLNHFTPLGSTTFTSFYALWTNYPLILTPFNLPWQPNSYLLTSFDPLWTKYPLTLTPFYPPWKPNSYLILPPLHKLPPHSYTILTHLAAQLVASFTTLWTNSPLTLTPFYPP